jgi:hypothetical protein
MSHDPETEDVKRADESGADPADDADTEGHSLALIAGLDALTRTQSPQAKRSKTADEELKPLTKPFPSLRNEARK